MTARQEREARLAAQLRANLRRRKDAARADAPAPDREPRTPEDREA